jgi:methionyl-tRNA synthetase
MRTIMALADKANQYIANAAPWEMRKDPARAKAMQDACSVALNVFRQLVVYLSPVLPNLRKQTDELLNQPIQRWDEVRTPLVGTRVSPFTHMMKRVEPAQVEAMIEESKKEFQVVSEPSQATAENTPAAAFVDGPDALAAEPLVTEQISIDDFTKVDLRVARIVEAEHVPEAKKLLKLKVSMGGDVTRQVFAGIKSAYEPEKLVGRLVVIVANLAPRQMKFGLSEGMVCAAGAGGTEIYLLSPDSGAKPGQRVH